MKKLLAGNFKPSVTKTEIPPEVAKLIAELDDNDWHVREKATEELKKMGDKIVPILRLVLAETKSFEVRTRIRQILGINANGEQNSDLLIASRVIRVLRCIGSEETKKAIATLENQYPQLKAAAQTPEQTAEQKEPEK